MDLEIKNKKVSLVYRTRKIVKITDLLKGKNFEDLYFKALTDNNIEDLSKIIFIFGEDKDTGLSAFNNSEEVYDFLDDYMEEKGKTYQDIFAEIAKDINKMGFFKTKMTEEELESKMKNYMALDMNEIVKSSAEKAITNVAQQEFKFSRG